MTEKHLPEHKGKIQTDDQKTVGNIALWNNLNPTSDKSPLMTGTIEVEIPEISATRKYRVSVWKSTPRQ